MSLRDYSENGQAFMRKSTEARRTKSDSRRRRLKKKRDEWRTSLMDIHSDYNQNGTMTRVTTLHHSDRFHSSWNLWTNLHEDHNQHGEHTNTQKHKNTTHNFHSDFQSRGNPWHERTWRFQSRLNPKNTQTKHKDLHAMTDYKNFMTIDRARIEQLNPWRLF